MKTELDKQLESMEMPCPCQRCGKWFELHDGELTQIAAKKMTRMDSDDHWDGNGKTESKITVEMNGAQAR